MRRLFLLLLVGLAACDDGASEITPELSPLELLDPAACKDCHPNHYREWSGSMHAYASVDPVFRALNAKGQAETDGALGDFCVQCHAPLALQMEATTDGMNLDAVPEHLQGITCAFCHQVTAVEGAHNNPLTVTLDGIMRGAIDDALPNRGHHSAYSPLTDRKTLESSDMCGSCHDIVVPSGLHLERSYWEWQNSVYASDDPLQQNTCGRCHMPGRNDVAADVEGVQLRRVHDHRMAGVDTALIDFPEREDQRAEVQRLLDISLISEICVIERQGGAEVEYYLENLAAGHYFPSGAALDRRAWVEMIATADGETIYESGVVGDGEPVAYLDDPDLWLLRDQATDINGDPTHDFWEIVDVTREFLPAPTSLDPFDPAYVNVHVPRRYRIPSPAPLERIATQVRMRAIGLEILDELVEDGLLDPAVRDAMPTFTLAGATLEWTPDAAELRISPFSGREALCVPRTLGQ